jgi:hypothetical protein
MAHTITATNGAGSTSPTAIEGYTPSRQSRNLIHDLLDGSIGVSLIAPRPRSGQLRLLYRVQADAFSALDLLAEESTFTLASTDVPAVGMSFVIDGSVDLDLDATVGNWWVLVGYQEVTP